MVLLFFIPVISVLIVLVFYRRPANRKILLLTGLYALAIPYLANEKWLLLDHHGLMHSTFVYQIIEHGFPPTNPYLAGEPLYYHWGYHLIVAWLVQALHLNPSLVFMLLNAVSLIAVSIILYRISQQLLSHPGSNLYSVIMAVYAITFTKGLLRLLGLQWFKDFRGLPILKKFSNVTGLPLGLVFSLLVLYCVIGLYQGGQRKRRYYLGIAAGVLGCGFIYFPLLPGTLAAIPPAIALLFIYHRKQPFHLIRPSLLILLMALLSSLALIPYFRPITAGVETTVRWLDPLSMKQQIGNLLLCLLPQFFLVAIAWRRIRGRISRQPLLILFAFFAVNLIGYICMHLPSGNVYKLMILMSIPLGILGGIAFFELFHRSPRWIHFLMLLLFTTEFLSDTNFKMHYMEDQTTPFFMQGIDISHHAPEERELNEWIRAQTPKECCFIDNQLTIPLIAHRPLYFALNQGAGYGFVNIPFFLQRICGHDRRITRPRQQLVMNLLEPDRSIGPQDLARLSGLGTAVYIVVRDRHLLSRFAPENFNLVFQSDRGEGNIAVFQVRPLEGQPPPPPPDSLGAIDPLPMEDPFSIEF